MSDEEVTFPTQIFLQSSPDSQNILRMDATQKPRKDDGKGMCFQYLNSPVSYEFLNF
jgi:hypothetical protein